MTNSFKIISTPQAPAAIGPYSQGIAYNGMIQTSGQIALDPKTGQMVGAGEIAAETRQVMANLFAILTAAGTTPDKIVKTTIFLADMKDFSAMNEIYGAALGEHRPARSTVQAAALPKGARVEIEALAMLG
jgi:2-iminobutanoate/2-iminopropanoate deaminase